MLTLEQLKELAVIYNADQIIDWTQFSETYRGRYHGIVKPKERPRFNRKTGRAYTDKATLQSERNIAKWAKTEGIPCVPYPIAIRLEIIEPCPPADEGLLLLSLRRVTYNVKGDLDNYAKTALDALNGYAYKDDKQIADLHLIRRYGRNPGFQIRIERAGLTKTELTNFRKVLTWQT